MRVLFLRFLLRSFLGTEFMLVLVLKKNKPKTKKEHVFNKSNTVYTVHTQNILKKKIKSELIPSCRHNLLACWYMFSYTHTLVFCFQQNGDLAISLYLP